MSEIVKDYRFNDEKGYWEMLIQYESKTDELVSEWCGCTITDVPRDYLLREWDSLLSELSLKEEALVNKKEAYGAGEFNIVYLSDIDFKAMYGSTSEKVRKEHARRELSDLADEITSLELSIGWIRMYIGLLKEVLRCKQ